MENSTSSSQQPNAQQPDAQRPPATVDPQAARAALDAVAASKAVVAQQMQRGPRWYNPVYGLLCGLLVLSIGLPKAWAIAGILVSAIGLGMLAGTYRKRTGIVLGTGNPRPRGIYPWLLAVLGVGAVASYLDGHHGFPLGVPIVAVAVGVACWVLSRRYDAAIFALLEEDDGVERVGGVGGNASQGEVRP